MILRKQGNAVGASYRTIAASRGALTHGTYKAPPGWGDAHIADISYLSGDNTVVVDLAANANEKAKKAVLAGQFIPQNADGQAPPFYIVASRRDWVENAISAGHAKSGVSPGLMPMIAPKNMPDGTRKWAAISNSAALRSGLALAGVPTGANVGNGLANTSGDVGDGTATVAAVTGSLVGLSIFASALEVALTTAVGAGIGAALASGSASKGAKKGAKWGAGAGLGLVAAQYLFGYAVASDAASTPGKNW